MSELRGRLLDAVTNNLMSVIVAVLLALGAWVFKQSINHAALAQEVKDHKALEAHPNTRQRQIDQLKGDVDTVKTEIKAVRREQKANHDALKELIDVRLTTLEKLIEKNGR